MKTVSLKIPEEIDTSIKELIKAGYFTSEDDFLLAAITQFVRRNSATFAERFAREDIEWAKSQSKKRHR